MRSGWFVGGERLNVKCKLRDCVGIIGALRVFSDGLPTLCRVLFVWFTVEGGQRVTEKPPYMV